MKQSIGILLVATTTTAAIVAYNGHKRTESAHPESRATEERESAARPASPSTSPDPPPGPLLSEGSIVGFFSDTYNHLVRWDSGHPEPYFEVRSQELNPTTQAWDVQTRLISTRFGIEALTHRAGDRGIDIFVAGTEGANTVIEHIRIPLCRGAYATNLVTLPPTLGVAHPPQASLSTLIAGGTYIEPSQRTCPPNVRTEIYLGSQIGSIDGIEVDPEGRFVLVVDGARVFQVPVQANAIPIEIGIVQQTAAVGYLMGGLTSAHHATEGRKYTLPADGPDWDSYLILHDYDNDGVFDAADDANGGDIWADPTEFEAAIEHHYDEPY